MVPCSHLFDLYDECRAGFVRPVPVITGLAGCKPADSSGNSWYITLNLGLQGGNYKKYAWEGNKPAIKTVWVRGVSKEEMATGYPIPVVATVLVEFYPMNGYSGVIAMIVTDVEKDLDLSSCV